MRRSFKVDSALLHNLKKLGELEDVSAKDREYIEGIGSFTRRTGKISLKQMKLLGSIYKKYLQDGEYVHHNWKIWE